MSEPLAPPCPRCGAPRAPTPECPRCGVIYAKADARAVQASAEREAADRQLAAREALAAATAPTFVPPNVEALPPEVAGTSPTWEAADDDPVSREQKLRLWVLPATLVGAWLLMASPFRGLVRIFLTMHVHEFGHAVTAWFCGFSAAPSLWVTSVSSTRGPVLSLMLMGCFVALGWRGWKTGRKAWMAYAVGLLAAQAVGTLGLSTDEAQALISFGGDGGCFVLGTALMATFYARPGSYLYTHGLRWGFLVIGATAYMDAFHTWWNARVDVDRIPFGLVDGTMSDPTKLVDVYGWSVGALIDRNVGLATACLGVLALLYGAQLYRSRAAASA